MADKDINYYISLNYSMTLEWDEDDKVYVVRFPDLPGCLAHWATPDAAVELAKEMKRDWIEAALDGGVPVPEPDNMAEYSGKFIVRMPRHLHKRLSEQAKSEGRSLNAHVAFLLSERSAALAVEKEARSMVEVVEKAVRETLQRHHEKPVVASCVISTHFGNIAPAGIITSTEQTKVERKFDA